MRRHVLIATMIVAAVAATRGDTPLPPPARHTANSPSGAIRAVSDPMAGTKIEDVKRHKVLWRLPGWYRRVFVADDGKHLVTGYDGLNLIPRDFSDDLVLVTFWREGRKIKEVRLRELFPDHRVLQATISHYAWGTIDGIDAQGRLKVRRVDGRIFYFDVSSGKEPRPNQAMQPTASKLAIYFESVCPLPFGCDSRFLGLAVADLVSR
jgi:hypothetical protein